MKKALLYILGTLLALAGISLISFSFLDYRQQKDLQSWPEINAKLTDHTVIDITRPNTNQTTFKCIVSYKFEINNSTYLSNSNSTTLDDSPTRKIKEQSISDCNELIKKDIIKIFYNPRNPTLSVVKKHSELNDIALSSYLGFFTFFSGISLIFIGTHLKK